jgi:hypothetical protein
MEGSWEHGNEPSGSVTEQLVASEEGPKSVELVSLYEC